MRVLPLKVEGRKEKRGAQNVRRVSIVITRWF